MAPDELLKTAEVARLLRVHPKHVYRLIDQGLPTRRVGSEWRFARDDVLAWSAGRQRPSTVARTTSPAGAFPPPLLGANGDVVIEVLLDQVLAQRQPLLGLVQADRSTALGHLGKRAILLAGFHGGSPPAALEAERLARIHLVRREVGIAHPARVAMKGLKDLARRRLATRPSTAGVRAHFDRALASARLTPRSLHLRTTLFDSHREAACAVVRGQVDAALTTRAWAHRLGLRFLSLAEESYDLLLFADCLGDRHVVGVCEVVQSSAFRAALAKVAGYDPRGAGEIRYDFGDASR
ncbi:MAG TPA: helix-turn-helix transcriptional regulator [Myxococcales bacterium]|nr:helix-turn-helix transcriptional regulator [Myxococcales bacterium]